MLQRLATSRCRFEFGAQGSTNLTHDPGHVSKLDYVTQISRSHNFDTWLTAAAKRW
jgi:hypothetical protein